MQKVSIIVPIYNAERYLERCIGSLVAQSHDDIEIILVIDGSTDSSADIAAQWAERDPRIVVATQPNLGQGAARNRGIQLAKGHYLMFVDADDSITSDYVETMLANADGVDVVQSGYKHVHPENNRADEHPTHSFYVNTVAWMRLYKRELFDNSSFRFPEGMYYEDVVFSVLLWQSKPKYRIIEHTGYCYTINSTSTTSTLHKKDRSTVMSMLRKMLVKGPRRHIVLYTIVRMWGHLYLR